MKSKHHIIIGVSIHLWYTIFKFILEEIEEEDGYRIVNLYLEKDYNDKAFPQKVHDSIRKKVTSDYYQKIFSKYDLDNDKKIKNIPI